MERSLLCVNIVLNLWRIHRWTGRRKVLATYIFRFFFLILWQFGSIFLICRSETSYYFFLFHRHFYSPFRFWFIETQTLYCAITSRRWIAISIIIFTYFYRPKVYFDDFIRQFVFFSIFYFIFCACIISAIFLNGICVM